MNLGGVVQSMETWRKLASINMKPKIAYQILKYVKLVTADFNIVEEQRVALIRELAEEKDGEIKIEAETPEWNEYVRRFNEILAVESELELLDVDFEVVIDALGDTEEVVSVSDLAILEPFFKNSDAG